MVAVTAASLVGFIATERRADEPILPLRLFTNHTFLISCSVGFIVGLSMFGSITFMPVYLQVVKGVSPSAAGLLLTPMMGGVLVTSIISGQIISRIGRYRFFPIAGTAVMTVAMGLLATLGADSSTWTAAGSMLLLGLGLGMVMQVLVLAVQNAVDYKELGVATSGTTLFRSIGGSVGVSLFGAIFAANLGSGLAERFPAGVKIPAAGEPGAIMAMSPELRSIYLDVFTAALHPIYLLAAGLAAAAFGLSWLLKEVPLRGPSRSETTGESFGVPHDATSLEELEDILQQIERGENRWDVIQRIARELAVPLAPDEIWLLIQLGTEGKSVSTDDLAHRFGIAASAVDEIALRLTAAKLVSRQADGLLSPTQSGKREFESMVASYRSRLAQLLERWSPDDHEEAKAMVTAHARSLVAELPVALQ
jgi:MFS family permease